MRRAFLNGALPVGIQVSPAMAESRYAARRGISEAFGDGLAWRGSLVQLPRRFVWEVENQIVGETLNQSHAHASVL